MVAQYKHGTYGADGVSIQTPVSNNETIIVAIVNTKSNVAGKGDVNEPVVVTSLSQYTAAFGYDGPDESTGEYDYSGDAVVDELITKDKLGKVVFISVGADYTNVNDLVNPAVFGSNFLSYVYVKTGLVADYVILPDDGSNVASWTYIETNMQSFASGYRAQGLVQMEETETETADIILDKPSGLTSKCGVFYGGFVYANKAKVPASVVYAGKQALQDIQDNGIPSSIASNKVVDGAISCYPVTFSREDANKLNEKGINLGVTHFGIRTWGGYCSTYDFSGSTDKDKIFLNTARMVEHIKRQFIARWHEIIDNGFTRNVKDMILNKEQSELNLLVAGGHLIGEPYIEFVESENSIDDMAQGQFVWHAYVTPTIPLVAATITVSYTEDGIATLVE